MPSPFEIMPTGYELVPKVSRSIYIWSVVITLMMIGTKYAASAMFPKWYNGLSARKKEEFPAYFVSIFHHFTLVPISYYYIYKEYVSDPTTEVMDYSNFLGIVVPIATGFIVGDTICFAFGQLLIGKSEYMLHHILAVWMIYALLAGPGELTRLYPHIMIADTTNIFFNTAWLLRLTEWKNHPIVNICELLFAFTFLVVRGIHLTYVFYLLLTHAKSELLGYARVTFIILGVLQFYWIFKIVQGIVYGRKTSGSKSQKHID